ncbi:MAG: hypothetical protein IPK22_05730 [Verrucomicrobiaceae bacterium]|nr:hypothetical protein [Verrucomicrobiaceae bacterium]
MKLLRLSLAVVFAASLMPTGSAAGADAFFSPDGKTVTIGLCGVRTGLIQVDVGTGKITKAPLPKELAEECIESIARGSEGETLFIAKDAVWVWKADAKPAVKRVCSTEPVVAASDLFVVTKEGSPLKDILFVSGNEKEDGAGMPGMWGRKPGSKSFVQVFCRRVNGAAAGTPTADGRFFFESGGDVWEGGISLYEADDAVDRIGVLVGARMAPVAALNTDEGNGGGQWVSKIAVAGGWIYCGLRGHHLGSVVRVPLPAKPMHVPDAEDFPTVKNQLDAMLASLKSAEVLEEDADRLEGFCATEVNGKPRLFYIAPDDQGPAMQVWEGAGKPRVIGHLPTEE